MNTKLLGSAVNEKTRTFCVFVQKELNNENYTKCIYIWFLNQLLVHGWNLVIETIIYFVFQNEFTHEEKQKQGGMYGFGME